MAIVRRVIMRLNCIYNRNRTYCQHNLSDLASGVDP